MKTTATIVLSFLFSLGMQSQENLQLVLEKFQQTKRLKEISFNKNNFQKYKYGDKFSDIIENKIVEIYKDDNQSTNFYLYYLDSFEQYSLYTLGHKDDNDIKVNCERSNAGGTDFILYDKKNNTVLYLESSSSEPGSIFKNKKNIIVLDYSLSPMFSKIIKLDDRLMPLSGIEYNEVENKYKLSLYDKLINGLEKKTTQINVKNRDGLFLIPMDELYQLLATRPTSFETSEVCDRPYCDSYISKIYFLKF